MATTLSLLSGLAGDGPNLSRTTQLDRCWEIQDYTPLHFAPRTVPSGLYYIAAIDLQKIDAVLLCDISRDMAKRQ